MTTFYERYQRQIILPGIGMDGQLKLNAVKILVIGAGGLGCPALQYLCAAGVGTLGIADDDSVSASNLPRQVIFNENDIGGLKAGIALDKLHSLNSGVTYNIIGERITNENALSYLRDYDIILDCTDNFSSRYLINDACVLLQKPLVFGAVSQFEGQLAIFNVVDQHGDIISYRDVFPDPPLDGEVKNCAEAGVLNVLPGMIGTMMAAEAIKLTTGIGAPLVNKLLTLNMLDYRQHIINLVPNSAARLAMPSSEAEYRARSYNFSCSLEEAGIIDINEFLILQKEGNSMLVDLRELWEQPAIDNYAVVNIPMSVLQDRLQELTEENIILVCQSGVRSLQAVRILREQFQSAKNLYSLKNGIGSLLKITSGYERKKD